VLGKAMRKIRIENQKSKTLSATWYHGNGSFGKELRFDMLWRMLKNPMICNQYRYMRKWEISIPIFVNYKQKTMAKNIRRVGRIPKDKSFHTCSEQFEDDY